MENAGINMENVHCHDQYFKRYEGIDLTDTPCHLTRLQVSLSATVVWIKWELNKEGYSLKAFIDLDGSTLVMETT
ncbi:hypothetical protein VNO80_02123 [Phaseolus coccineus]|uniref:Uncharacterized protein n=1 Tax=Phaseolus coccineus TaxID=3886 RepID=A0AAN9NNT5_PHACN